MDTTMRLPNNGADSGVKLDSALVIGQGLLLVAQCLVDECPSVVSQGVLRRELKSVIVIDQGRF